MNKVLKIFLMLPIVAMVSSCSNDDEPAGLATGVTEATKGVSTFATLSDVFQPVHTDLMSDLLAGKQAMTFSFTGYDVYERWEGEKKYEYFDQTGWYGFSCSMPIEIIFSEGKVWAPYSTFSTLAGPTKIGMAWNAYKTASGEITSLYVGHDFSYAEAERNVHFLGREFVMVLFNRNSFVLAENGPCWKDCQDEGVTKSGEFYHIIGYERTADVAMLEPGALGFASNQDVAAYIIDKCREFFGDVINLNEVYAPNVIFDDPYIYLDELEEDVAAGREYGEY